MDETTTNHIQDMTDRLKSLLCDGSIPVDEKSKVYDIVDELEHLLLRTDD